MISLRSKITQKLLGYFFINPDKKLYIQEMCKKFNLDKRNLVKKLYELEKNSILTLTNIGNLKLYSINTDCPLYNDLKNLFNKTIGIESNLKQIVNKEKDIKKAIIYGSYALENLNTYSDIDLLLIGDHNIIKFQRKISRIQNEIDREINNVNMDLTEYNKRKRKKNPFIINIFNNKHMILKDEL